MITKAKQLLALFLFDSKAVKFGKFRLKLHDRIPDAPLSPIYIDLRILRSFPEIMDSITDVYNELTKGLKFDLYADVPTAATPIVSILSYKNRIPMITPRKEGKGHGIKRRIDGVFREGQVVLLVDDLVTLADSKFEAISLLEENGLKVHDVAVLINREQGGVRELEKRGYACHVAYQLRELLRFYLEVGKIGTDQYWKTVAYLEKSQF